MHLWYSYLTLALYHLPLFFCISILCSVDSAPADYASINGTFTSCESDNQRYPGVYVNSNGQTVT